MGYPQLDLINRLFIWAYIRKGGNVERVVRACGEMCVLNVCLGCVVFLMVEVEDWEEISIAFPENLFQLVLVSLTRVMFSV